MKRLLWLGAGLAIGALVVRAVSRRAQSYTPRGIAAAMRNSGRNALDSVRDFVDDVREGMREREFELQAALAEGRALTDESVEAEHDVDRFVDDPADRGDDRGQTQVRGRRYPTEDTTP
ncbi:MAG TPA: hypothetical protein VKZ74_04930 [Natronosporangium sp.]|nr:hypothetical protein [Natronosporangium sp.]